MKITIDTSEIAGKATGGIKKYGKYALPGSFTSKGARILGKKLKEKADRRAIENRMKRGISQSSHEEAIRKAKNKVEELSLKK